MVRINVKSVLNNLIIIILILALDCCLREQKSELAKKWFKRIRLLLTNLIAKSRWDLGQGCEPVELSVPPWRTKINNCYCISNLVDLGLSFLRLLKAPDHMPVAISWFYRMK